MEDLKIFKELGMDEYFSILRFITTSNNISENIVGKKLYDIVCMFFGTIKTDECLFNYLSLKDIDRKEKSDPPQSLKDNVYGVEKITMNRKMPQFPKTSKGNDWKWCDPRSRIDIFSGFRYQSRILFKNQSSLDQFLAYYHLIDNS